MISNRNRRLDVFRAIIEHGGINAAADWLGISQPSVTAHVRALEKEIGTTLFFRRRGHRNTPTDAAEVLYGFACDAAARSTELRGRLRDLAAVRADSLSIAVQRSIANYVMSPALAAFLKRHARARVSVHTETQEAVRELFRSGRVDAAVLFADESFAQPQIIIGRQPLVLIAGTTHPLARCKNISVPDLASYAFVGGLQGAQFTRLIESALRSIGLERYRVVLHLQDTMAVKNAVLHGIGIACTLAAAVEEDVEQGRLVMLQTRQAPPSLSVEALTRNDTEALPLWPAFLECLRHAAKMNNPQ